MRVIDDVNEPLGNARIFGYGAKIVCGWKVLTETGPNGRGGFFRQLGREIFPSG
jgi:hypothetical protein